MERVVTAEQVRKRRPPVSAPRTKSVYGGQRCRYPELGEGRAFDTDQAEFLVVVFPFGFVENAPQVIHVQRHAAPFDGFAAVVASQSFGSFALQPRCDGGDVQRAAGESLQRIQGDAVVGLRFGAFAFGHLPPVGDHVEREATVALQIAFHERGHFVHAHAGSPAGDLCERIAVFLFYIGMFHPQRGITRFQLFVESGFRLEMGVEI